MELELLKFSYLVFSAALATRVAGWGGEEGRRGLCIKFTGAVKFSQTTAEKLNM